MPELPEVETVRRQLAPRLEGRMLVAYRVSDARWTMPRDPAEVLGPLVGRRVAALRRRGKYLIAAFEDELFLLMHLRMTGNLLYDAPASAPYTRAIMGFDDEHTLSFVDPRRFGTAALVAGQPALDAYLAARLGVEPFSEEFTGERLHALARGSRAPVKAFLLDQRRIAGVGNIYADEALFRARIHPLRPAGSLKRDQFEALAIAVREALQAGLAAGGASIDDFRHVDGVRGAFQNEFLVHLRRGEPCLRCATPVVKFVAAGRGTYACESCQPRPRRRRARRPAR
jgi:formamidopyrimidine-DNA glycosylase